MITYFIAWLVTTEGWTISWQSHATFGGARRLIQREFAADTRKRYANWFITRQILHPKCGKQVIVIAQSKDCPALKRDEKEWRP